MWSLIGLGIGAFFLGGIPVGYLAGRAKGVDIRRQGSGNIGATNVARVLGARSGLFVLLLDVLKGAIPCLVARAANLETSLVIACGLMAFLGHVFSPFLRFRGGKGIATGFGMLLAAEPVTALIALGAFCAAFLAFRIVSIASLTAAVSAPLAGLVRGLDPLSVALLLGLAAVAFWTHRANLARLVQGKEPRFSVRSRTEGPN